MTCIRKVFLHWQCAIHCKFFVLLQIKGRNLCQFQKTLISEEKKEHMRLYLKSILNIARLKDFPNDNQKKLGIGTEIDL